MYDAATSFSADVVGDAHHQVTISQTGPDTASIDLRAWPIGSNYAGVPASDAKYSVTGVRVLGNRLTCTESMWFLSYAIELDLSPPGNQPSATVKVAGIGANSTMIYPITQADHDEISKFLVAAAFPAG